MIVLLNESLIKNKKGVILSKILKSNEDQSGMIHNIDYISLKLGNVQNPELSYEQKSSINNFIISLI